VTSDVTPSSEEALPPAPGDEAMAEFSARCSAIEEAYEFMLAYAAQGLANEDGSVSGSQIREFLRKCDAALTGLGEALTHCVRRLDIRSLAPYDAFIGVVERDVRSAQAAVQLVLAQRSISSQLVDNLNASIHLRAVLTDLFLLDDVLKCNSTEPRPWPDAPRL
jgi:hypothetical protein